ncbi:hypothetical protein HHK36_031868 [Tetracentron sinense]|uniref:Uncharacterized protein n=1 Tax=Tetracentron sinense TaxID=13715 RepID=A0A835D0Y7_TETSI|nr:hypothetical protein HHK36_031868 [Tetracentron sinense]
MFSRVKGKYFMVFPSGLCASAQENLIFTFDIQKRHVVFTYKIGFDLLFYFLCFRKWAFYNVSASSGVHGTHASWRVTNLEVASGTTLASAFRLLDLNLLFLIALAVFDIFDVRDGGRKPALLI